MTPHRSRPRLGRTPLVGLVGAALVLAGCALVTAASPPAVVLSDGKPRALLPGELVVPPDTLGQWRNLLGDGKNRLVARCSAETGLCTTVVVPLGGSGGSPLPPQRCPRGELPVQDSEGLWRCPSEFLFGIVIAK